MDAAYYGIPEGRNGEGEERGETSGVGYPGDTSTSGNWLEAGRRRLERRRSQRREINQSAMSRLGRGKKEEGGSQASRQNSGIEDIEQREVRGGCSRSVDHSPQQEGCCGEQGDNIIGKAQHDERPSYCIYQSKQEPA